MIRFPKRLRDKRGIFDFGVSGDYQKSKSRTEKARPEFVQAPDYAEAEGARKSWWDRLQQWGSDPNYGAIAPNWGDMWQQGQQKIRDYYWGTATQPGLIGKVKGSAARRGVSGQPAMEKEITKMGVEEGGQIGDMTSQMNIAQADFGEKARQNWLQSLMGLAQVNPQGQWYTPWQTQTGSQIGVGAKGNVTDKWW